MHSNSIDGKAIFAKNQIVCVLQQQQNKNTCHPHQKDCHTSIKQVHSLNNLP